MRINKRILGSTFLRHNAVLFVASILVGAANYLFYPVVGRFLTPTSFGEVQALVALFTQLTLLIAVLGQVTVNVTANYTDPAKRQAVLFELEKLALLLMLGASVVLALFSFQLKSFFHFTSLWPFLLLLLALIASVPGSFRTAYLRANKAFSAASVSQLLGSIGKIILAVIFVGLGLKSSGALGGLAIAQLITFAYAAYVAKKHGFFVPRDKRYTAWPDIQLLIPELTYAVLVFISSGAITLMTSLDIFVVKHYYSPHLAGEYAAISTVANIIFFLTNSVSQVMMPSVRLQQSAHENRQYFIKSFALTLLLGGSGLTAFLLFPRLIIRLLMGDKYLAFTSLLPWLGLAMFLLAILNLVVCYYLALRRYQLIGIICVGILIGLTLMAAHHDSLRSVIDNLSYTSLATLLLLAAWQGVSNWFGKKATAAESQA